jgi:alpha-glucosidase (family GH31 glycosyl hydrolase)
MLLVACGGSDPAPVDVSVDRLTARIHSSPPQIEVLLDGAEVWSTRAGTKTRGNDPPHGFAATGSLAVTTEMMFGSFKFDEKTDAERWRALSKLDDVTVTDTGATFVLRAGDATIGTGRVTLDPARLDVRIELDADSGDRISLAAECTAEGEHLVGLGGQSFDVDHRGETVPLFVQEDGIGKFPEPDDIYAGLWFLTGRKHSTHTPMPMLLSSRPYALALDTNARAVFALASEADDVCRFEAWDRKLDLHVFVGDERFGHMIDWVGKAPAPSELVFAPWVDALFGSANVRRVADKLRSTGAAASVIWTEDWRGGEDTSLGYALKENWRVDRSLYPDFEQVANDLRADGFAFHTYHNTFIDETADIRAEAEAKGYAIEKDGMPYHFTGVKFTPSTMLDLSNPAAVTWAKGVMGEAITLGSDGWMADFAEWLPHDAELASGEDPLAVHNRYTVEWARFNRELFAANRPANRPPPIFFMRSAWLHSQPEVPVMWAGDQQTDWTDGDGFPSVIPIGLGLGLAGFPYFGHDIGGYMDQGTTPTSEELFYRWTTLGALSPVMRTHHGRNIMQNWNWEKDAATTAHFRRWTRFHMQLVPYLMAASDEFAKTGLPLFRMIALSYPDEDWAWTTIDQYLLGDRILVAPIVAQGATSRTVTLPRGNWIPLLGGAPVSGVIEATAARTEIPAFVPEGALLLLYPDGVTTVLPSTTDDREVWLFLGTAQNPAHATAPGYTWTGRTGAAPAAATFGGAPATFVAGAVTVTGDGTLDFAGGGSLTIARGKPTARTTVRFR